MPTTGHGGRRQDLVVKFSRFAQNVPLHVSRTFSGDISDDEVRSAEFNDPFQEFGLLCDLRRGHYGPGGIRIRTKRPLAIFCPSERLENWQLGRERWKFERSLSLLRSAQSSDDTCSVDLHFSRQYVYLFAWVHGENAEDLMHAGHLTETEVLDLTKRVVGDLALKGFKVLDNKPHHFILRPLPDGGLLRRAGDLVYCLVDFELLKRTEEYKAFLLSGFTATGGEQRVAAGQA